MDKNMRFKTKFSVVSLWIVLAGSVAANGFECSKGWFGSSCEYRCRCQGNNCNIEDGQCLNSSRCQPGWFGPACQYADLAQSETMIIRGSRQLSVVTDSNEDTCLGALTKEVSVRWAIPYQVTWIRVYFQESYLLNRVSVKFKTDWNRQILCNNTRTYKVNERAVDIYCDLDVTVTQLVLAWEGRSYLCSLYISGVGRRKVHGPGIDSVDSHLVDQTLCHSLLPGAQTSRNVALKQNTTQSSTSLSTFKTPHSSNAVDGDTNSDYIYGNCAQTGRDDPSPKWTLMFSRNFTVNRYLIYHKINARYFMRRSYWFTLQGLTMTGKVVFTDRGAGSTQQNVYRVTTASSTTPIGQVIIQSEGNSQRFTAAPSMLSLCEIEVYGESICEAGMYGRDCDHRCNCVDQAEACFVSTGGCTSGCAVGYMGQGCSQVCPTGRYGMDCMSTCSQLCQADSNDINVCNHDNGTCLLGCQVGFDGPWCNMTCTPGTFGQGCSYECSSLCASDGSNRTQYCHHLHGVCLQGCQPGYKGLMCNEPCSPGRFGPDCNMTCSPLCQHDNRNLSICEYTTGACLLGCRPGYSGPSCDQMCAPGYYGLMCRSMCSEFCSLGDTSNTTCHHVDGSCLLGCQDGYTGQLCHSVCKLGSYGRDCTATCSQLCAPDSSGAHHCHHVDGVCLRGCVSGFEGPLCNKTCENGIHGKACSLQCPQLCEVINIDQQICHHIYGTCLQGCQAGYTGPACNMTCDSGIFGQDCSFLCPQFCRTSNVSNSICNHIHGECLQGCQDGFAGRMCNEPCGQGTFGPSCGSHCSLFCGGDSTCDPVDGACLQGCLSGFTGPLCNEKCPPGKFGLTCEFECSSHCIKSRESDAVCYHVNGSCLFGCRENFVGHNCTLLLKAQATTTDTNMVWVALAILGGAVLSAVGTIFWWRRRQIRSHMLNTAIQVKVRKSSSTDSILKSEVSDLGSQSFTE